MYKRILAVALAMAMILGLASVALAASPFPDTVGHKDEGTIALLKALDLVKGDDLGYFNPDDTITRAEFCAMIVRALGLEKSAGFADFPTQFPDVGANQAWAYGYINVAVSQKIIEGYPDGTFKPSDPVSQGEALTMVMRALGYRNSLPGPWPLNYIMEGARQGVDLVEAGFAASTSAARAFVAHMIGNLLGKSFVVENKDNPGQFDPVTPSPGPFSEVKLGVVPGVSGVVASVNTTTKTITIDEAEKDYISAVAVYGKVDKVADLKGYAVKTWINGKDEIVFISTTVADYVVGKVTAVNVSDGTLTVGGVVYTAAGKADGDGLDATKNSAELTGSLANKLVALKDTTASIWLNADGEAYKIEARFLEHTGEVIAKKITSVDADGVVYKLVFADSATEHSLAKDATITKNNVAAVWADLKTGDNCSFTLESGKIVWLDAWKNVVKGVKVTAKLRSGTTYQVTGLLGDETVVYTCDTVSVYNTIQVGSYYDFSLNRDGKVYDLPTMESSKIVGTIVGSSISVEGSPAVTVYRVALADGTSVAVPLADLADGAIIEDSRGLDMPEVNDRAQFFTDVFAVKRGIYLERNAAGVVTLAKVYSPVLKGVGQWISSQFKVKLSDSDYTAAISLATGASVTLNGVTTTLKALGEGEYNVTLSWDVETGKAAKVAGVDFLREAASAVAGISSDAEGNYVFNLVNDDEVSAPVGTIVIRDGEKAVLSDIKLGDKLLYDAEDPATYIEAAIDEDAPKLDTYVAEYDGDLTVTLTFNEEVQRPTVWIDGVKYTKTVAGEVQYSTCDSIEWVITVIGVDDPGNHVSLAVTASDYAGNVLNVTPGMIPVAVP